MADDYEHTLQENWVCMIPGSGRPPGEGNGYLLQHSCLKNSLDRGACTAHGVAESDITEQLPLFTETGFKSAGWGETTDLRFSIIFWNTKEVVSTHLVFCKIQRRHTALKFCHKKEVWSSCTHRKSDIASESQQGYGRYLSPEGR